MAEAEIKLKEAGKIARLTDATFQFDKRFKEGFYSANYFLKTRKIVAENLPGNIVTLQFFQRHAEVMVCGLDEVVALLQVCAAKPQDLQISALADGAIVKAGEPVLKITGRYEDFGYLESAIDGILARRSSVATNAMRVLKVANGKAILNMGDRQDDPHTQMGDGYAAYVAGLRLFSTDAQGAWVAIKGGGTMPHALIEICQGDVCKASDLYLKTYPDQPLTALIDYRNDAIHDGVKLAKHLGRKLGCLRLDTSEALIDHWFDDKKAEFAGTDLHGVTVEQVKALRQELDKSGFNYVKICVSSGFGAEKIANFEKNRAPVDIYGVGTYLTKIFCGFTGDLVTLNGQPEAKEGRFEVDNPRLEPVKLAPVNP